jgi:formate-dependent nitrite reductase membrane component NrfD
VVWPTALFAIASAGYSAFLFAQARGRDFWQSPTLFWHLIVRALSAGAAMFILIGALELVTPYQFVSPPMFFWLVNILVISILAGFALMCGELFIKHGSEESLRAGSLLVSGRLGKAFWPLVVGAGVILPAALILWQPGATMVAAAAALFGLWMYEHLWIKAGQAMPLS